MLAISAQIAAHTGFLRHCLGLSLDDSNKHAWDATALVGVFSEASGPSYKTIFLPAQAGRASTTSRTAARAAVGAFLAHLSMALRSLNLSTQGPKDYNRVYKLTQQVPALRMCGLFTTMEVMTVTVEGSAVILNHAPLQGSVALLVCLAGAVSLQSHSVLADHALVLCDFNTGRGGDGLALQVRAEQGSPCVVVLLSVAGPAVLSSATAKQVEQWSKVATEIEEAQAPPQIVAGTQALRVHRSRGERWARRYPPSGRSCWRKLSCQGQAKKEGSDTSCSVEQQSKEGGVTRDASPTWTSPGASPNSGCLQAAPRTSTHCTPALQFSYRLA